MALDGTLKHWNNGEPTIPDEGLLGLKHWLNGESYTIIKVAPPAAAIMNQFQTSNIGANLYNGALST